MSLGNKKVDEIGANKAGSSSDENFHGYVEGAPM
jgi:hypothetical protein